MQLATLEAGAPGRGSSALPAASGSQRPLNRNPAAVYLASLVTSGRRSMRSQLDRAAWLLTEGRVTSALDLEWEQVRYPEVRALRSVLVEQQTLAPATINLLLAGVRGCVREAWRLGYVEAEVWVRVKEVPLVKARRLPAGRHVDTSEIKALFAGCRGRGPSGQRDAAILALLYGAGLRRAEAVAVELGDYNRAAGSVRVRSGKGAVERMAYIDGGARAAVADWLQVRGRWEGPMLAPVRGKVIEARGMSAQSLFERVRLMAARAGVAPLSPHDLRRSFVGELTNRTGDLSAVQQLVGHASIATTQRYDRRGEAVKRKVAGSLGVPYERAE